VKKWIEYRTKNGSAICGSDYCYISNLKTRAGLRNEAIRRRPLDNSISHAVAIPFSDTNKYDKDLPILYVFNF
jgi:hypothetical protein